ncbi:hypothetical protein, partial [Enterobacter bugandensis]|uniref:hypothetical protein n=1 Tax=Enterobacter bugandensis TaxID=881260 RepID=UPI001953E849
PTSPASGRSPRWVAVALEKVHSFVASRVIALHVVLGRRVFAAVSLIRPAHFWAKQIVSRLA